jgi:hypothetical protein
MGPAARKGPTPGIARVPNPASQPSTPPAPAPKHAAGGGAFRRFGVLLVRKVFRALAIGEQDGNIVRRKAHDFEFLDNLAGDSFGFGNAEYGVAHDSVLMVSIATGAAQDSSALPRLITHHRRGLFHRNQQK